MITPKRKRISQACDFCHRRGLKCKPAPDPGDNRTPESCLTCLEHGQECTRSRQPKKRGTKPRGPSNPPSFHQVGGSHDPGSVLGSRRIITALLDVYLDSIHPTFPLFCERELWVGWRDGSFPNDSSDYMSLTCMCALSAQHVDRRALFTDDIDASVIENLQEDYLTEAVRLVPIDLESSNLNLIRSYGFLALLGAQNGDNAMLHKYLGLYHGVCAHLNLQDESRWPANITDCDREVRRRLFWAIYRLEVHTACVLGNLVRSSEAQSNVGYPVGLHHPAFIAGRTGLYEDWFSGWNTTTDLYRVLEHVIFDFRSKGRSSHSILGRPETTRSDLITERLAKLQEHALPQFGFASSRSDDSGRNRCGFQASNILCTIHLARLLSCISEDNNIQLACQTAHDMVESMSNIPLEYVRAIGSPLIQQLAGVGHILVGIAVKQHISQQQLQDVRNVVSSILALLDKLKDKNSTATASHQRLAAQLVEAEKSKSTAEESIDVPVESFQWPSEEHFLENSDEYDGFPSQLLAGFTWPYLDSASTE